MSSSTTSPAPGYEDDRPLGELFSDMTRSLQTLMRKEVELAKVEVQEQASRAGRAAALLGAMAVIGFVGLLLLSFAAALGLAEGVPTWLAFLAIGALYVVIAGLLFAVAKPKLASVRLMPEQTVRTLRQDVDVAKSSVARGVHS